MLPERGIIVPYETVRRWARKFGQDFIRRLRRKQPSHRDIWHLDEVAVSIGGLTHWLWRAVDQEGYVLVEILQTRRDAKAAARLLRRLLKKQGGAPKRVITDKLGSYAAAIAHVGAKESGPKFRDEHRGVVGRRRRCRLSASRENRHYCRFTLEPETGADLGKKWH